MYKNLKIFSMKCRDIVFTKAVYKRDKYIFKNKQECTNFFSKLLCTDIHLYKFHQMEFNFERLNILFSWYKLLEKLSFIILTTNIFFIGNNIIVIFLILLLSIICMLLSIYMKHKTLKFKFEMEITHSMLNDDVLNNAAKMERLENNYQII